MSQALSQYTTQAGPLRPEARLSQTIAEFERLLSPEQQRTLSESRQQVAPTSDSVIALTGEIGRQSHHAGSNVGPQLTPRFRKVVSVVRILTSLVDLVVGGSQNLIASAVWGVLKTALESVSRYDDFLEKLSRLFLSLGQTVPDLKDYAIIYPKADGLHSSILEYTIVIVNLCKEIVTFANKSAAKRILYASTRTFESHFSPYQRQLEEWGLKIDRHAALAMARSQSTERTAQEEERRTNARMRQLFFGFTEQARRDRKHRARSKALKACELYSSESTWARARKRGSARWLIDSPKYLAWRSCSGPSILHCVGTIGSGKSVIAANVVEELLLNRDEKEYIAYHFCSYDEHRSLIPEVILGSLIRQLLESGLGVDDMDESLVRQIESMHSFGAGNHLQIVRALLKERKETLDGDHHIYFVIDGLEELKIRIPDLLRQLIEPFEGFNVRIFFTSTNRQALNMSSQEVNVNVERPSKDIEEYVVKELVNRLENDSLNISKEEIILVIKEKLTQEANGMFLWVFLQLEDICRQHTDEGILLCLNRLPKDLPETYNRILARSTNSDDLAQGSRSKPRKLLEVAAVSMRNLTAKAMQEALGVEPGNLKWAPLQFVNNIEAVVRSCNGLIIVDEEDSRISFLHRSAHIHLLSSEAASYQIHETSASKTLGSICLTYLGLDIMDRQVGPARREHAPPAEIIAASVAQTLPTGQAWTKAAALRLLKSSSARGNFDVQKYLEDLPSMRQGLGQNHLHWFRDYAENHWQDHNVTFDDEIHLKNATWESLESDFVQWKVLQKAIANISGDYIRSQLDTTLHKIGDISEAHHNLKACLVVLRQRYSLSGILALIKGAYDANNRGDFGMLTYGLAILLAADWDQTRPNMFLPWALPLLSQGRTLSATACDFLLNNIPSPTGQTSSQVIEKEDFRFILLSCVASVFWNPGPTKCHVLHGLEGMKRLQIATVYWRNLAIEVCRSNYITSDWEGHRGIYFQWKTRLQSIHPDTDAWTELFHLADSDDKSCRPNIDSYAFMAVFYRWGAWHRQLPYDEIHRDDIYEDERMSLIKYDMINDLDFWPFYGHSSPNKRGVAVPRIFLWFRAVVFSDMNMEEKEHLILLLVKEDHKNLFQTVYDSNFWTATDYAHLLGSRQIDSKFHQMWRRRYSNEGNTMGLSSEDVRE